MLTFLRGVLRRVFLKLGGPDLVLLLAVLALVLGGLGFFLIAGLVYAGSTQDLDTHILHSLRDPEKPDRPLGQPWMWELGRDLTALGGVTVLCIITVAGGGVLLLYRKYHALGLLLLTIGGGLLVSSLLKESFDRPRPPVASSLSFVSTSSFPSGHSALSAIVYLTLAALLARLVQPMRLKLYFLVVALLLSCLVGLSRVYLRVHYPSDVLAGWAAGLTWAVLCWLLARYLQHRGAVEKPIGASVHEER